MANWEAYRAMKAEAERVGWPEHYETDLTKHDRLRLSRKTAPESFIWVLRECGTFILDLGNGPELDWILATRTLHGQPPNLSGRRARWYIWENDELRTIEPDAAVDRFAESLRGQPVHRETREGPRWIGTFWSIYRRRGNYGTKTFVEVKTEELGATKSYVSDKLIIGEREPVYA